MKFDKVEAGKALARGVMSYSPKDKFEKVPVQSWEALPNAFGKPKQDKR